MTATGTRNTGLGNEAGTDLTTGNYNTLVGNNAGANLTTASHCTIIGDYAGWDTTTGGTNTFLGQGAGYNATGTGNVLLGYAAGQTVLTSGANQLYIARSNTAASNAATWIHGDGSGNCYQGNNNTAWSTTSDRRLKKNIVDSSKGLAEINQLRVANFEYRTEDEIDMTEFPLADSSRQVVLGEGNEGVHTGIIAQEVEAVLPECIRVSEQGAKTVQTDPIMWALVNAVKELSAEVQQLKSQINN